MIKKILMVAAVAAIFAIPSTAQAGIFSSLFSFDGSPDVVTDDSAGIFIERGTVDGVLEAGDLLQGMISFGPIAGTDVPTGQSVVGAYSLEVLSIGPGGSSLELGAASGLDDIVSILAAAGADTSGLTGSHAGAANGIAVLEANASVGRPDFTAPFGFGAPTTDFDVVMTLGFDGVDDQHTVVANNLLPGGDLTDLSAIDGLSGLGIAVANFFGTYTITDHSFGASTIFLPLFNPLSGGTGDVTILNGGISSTNADTVDNGFDFNDDGDFNINAVPEPATCTMFGAILFSGFWARRRRS